MSTMYLVVRRALERHGIACEDQSGTDTGSRVPLRLFSTRAAADAFVETLKLEARRTMNPFHITSGSLNSHIRKQLASLELPVACPEDSWHGEWKVWWDLCQDSITDELRAVAWAILNANPPFEVIATEVDDE